MELPLKRVPRRLPVSHRFPLISAIVTLLTSTSGLRLSTQIT